MSNCITTPKFTNHDRRNPANSISHCVSEQPMWHGNQILHVRNLLANSAHHTRGRASIGHRTLQLLQDGLVVRGKLWNVDLWVPQSVDFGAGELNHVGPLLCICGDEGAEVGRRANWKHGYYSREAKAERSRLRRQCLRSAICATRSKGPAVSVGYGPHRTIYLTGIDANGKVARASARRRFRALS